MSITSTQVSRAAEKLDAGLAAVGITQDGRRRVLGVSVALFEAEVHWRAFLDSLIRRSCRPQGRTPGAGAMAIAMGWPALAWLVRRA